MFIIPYYIESKSVENFKLTKAWIFMTNCGMKIWETEVKDNEIIDLYLNPNGLFGKTTCVKGDTLYFEVDLGKTRIADFYTWTDFLDKGESIPSDLDVWRPFVWVSDTNVSPGEKDSWGWQDEVKNTMVHKFWTTVCEIK